MSVKSLLQLILFLLIILIIGGIYYLYFYSKSVNQIELKEELGSVEKNILNSMDMDDNRILDERDEIQKKNNIDLDQKKTENNQKNNKDAENLKDTEQIKNLTKEIEYLTTNKNGDIFEIVAKFGKTNLKNNNILDLEIVNGVITSIDKSKIYIYSDFAEYNYTNQNSKFYSNVEIKYDKRIITCDNLDLNITENVAVAYSNVKVKDEESLMKAQVVVMDIITKDITINSEDKIKIFTK